jgi:hypothetical protein
MSKTFAETMCEDRRQLILVHLSHATGYHLNDEILRSTISRTAIVVGLDQVRAEAQWLEAAGLVRIEVIPSMRGEIWVLHLTNSGLEVAEGRQHAGVSKLRPG